MKTPNLDKFMHANQGLLEGVEGGGVQHLLLDLGAVRAPIENRDVIEAYKTKSRSISTVEGSRATYTRNFFGLFFQNR